MSYTDSWTDGHGTVQYFTRSDGSRLRYFTAGSGPALVLMHTIRTQLDYFHRVIPQLWDSFTVYALDLPGMGWSDIVPGARYEERDLRAAVVEFVTDLDLHDVTLAGESLGGALALHAAVDLKGRVARVVAFNTYDYPSGLERGNVFARFIISSVRMPGLGPVFAAMENRPIMKGIMRGGVVDNRTLPDDAAAAADRVQSTSEHDRRADTTTDSAAPHGRGGEPERPIGCATRSPSDCRSIADARRFLRRTSSRWLWRPRERHGRRESRRRWIWSCSGGRRDCRTAAGLAASPRRTQRRRRRARQRARRVARVGGFRRLSRHELSAGPSMVRWSRDSPAPR